MKISKRSKKQSMLHLNTQYFIQEIKREDFLAYQRFYEWDKLQQRIERYLRALKSCRFLAWEIVSSQELLESFHRMKLHVQFLRRWGWINFLLGDAWWRHFAQLQAELSSLPKLIHDYELSASILARLRNK